MLYLYVELRYHRQLHRICPDIPVRLFSALGDSVRKNGGQVLRMGSAMLYSFDHASAGFAFSASRVIDDVRVLLADMRERIREYFILVDSSDTPLNPDAFRERLHEYDAMVTPDESILLTPEACSLLSSYVASIPLEGTSLSQYTGIANALYSENVPDLGEEGPRLFLYTDYPGEPVKLLRDMLAAAGETELSPGVTDPQGEQSAVESYCWYRYSENQSDYRTEAVLAHYSRQLMDLGKRSAGPVAVTLKGDAPPNEDIVFLKETLSGLCRFSGSEQQQFMPADPDSIPPDLLDMAYMMYRVQKYVYYDELPAFFRFMDKDASFMESLGSWLYSYGVLSCPKDFRSLNPALEDRITGRCGNSAAVNDRRIANFLWSHYTTGLLAPSIELYGVFTDLGYPVDDSFRAGCCFFCGDAAHTDELYASFNSVRVRDAVRQLETGKTAFARKEYGKAESIAREVLHCFQKENIPYGEYQAFILLSRLSLVRNKGDDAVVYLEYARDNAVRTRHQFSVLESSCELACVHFGVGSFDASMSVAGNAAQTARNCFAKDHESFLLFLKGRLFFETGDYRNAAPCFQEAATVATVYRFPHGAAMARVWYGRTLAHEARYHAADQIFEEYRHTIPEVAAFQLESAILSGHPAEKDLLVIPEIRPADDSPVSGGFSWIEDRLITGNDTEKTAAMLFRAMHAYHRARFSGEDCVEDTLAVIDDIARNAYARNDPYAALYYYLCFELARFIPAGASSDGTGYLSRAFKYVQKRAKEIGDTMLREQFMVRPVWNSRLFRAAREHMLI